MEIFWSWTSFVSTKKTSKVYSVRRQIRKEIASARDAFYTELKENPTSKQLYRLI